jgi:Recombinase
LSLVPPRRLEASSRPSGNRGVISARRENVARIAEVIEEIRDQEGIASASAIAKRLTELGVRTPRGHGDWQANQVQRVLAAAR